MKKYLSVITVLLLFACSDHDTYPENAAVAKACKVCHTDLTEMQWLRTLIHENKGNVFAIKTSDGVYFVHQPVYMSCLVCDLYSCSGSQSASVTDIVQQELQNGIKKSNLIYEA